MARIGTSQLTPDQIQAKVMSFTDRYIALTSQGFDDVSGADDSLAVRRLVSRLRIVWVSNALAIGSSKNPVTALLDMTVMVTLQRQTWDEQWRRTHFTDERAESLSRALRMLEEEIWELNEAVLTPDECEALRAMIVAIRERYPDVVDVSSLRASELAAERQVSLHHARGGGSLFRLFGLDPMANLSPATRQFAESRLLGERMFFYASRAVLLMNWHIEAALLESVAEPEMQRIITAVDRAGESSERAAAVMEDVAAQITEERTAAIDQVAERLREERTLAVDQFFEGIRAEREAFLERLNAEERLQGTLAEMRGVVEAGTTLSDSVQATLVEAGRLTERLDRGGEGGADSDFDIAEFTAAATAATESFESLNRALVSANQLADTLAAEEQEARFRSILGEGTGSAEALIDRIYRRAIVLIIVFGVCLFAAMAAYRLLVARLLTRPAR